MGKNYSNYLLLAIAGILFGTVTVGAQVERNFGLSVYEGAFYPQVLSFILVIPFLFVKKRYKIVLGNLKFFIIYGLIQGILQIFQIGGVILGAPVAVIAFLLYTQPVYTSIFGKLLLSENISSRKIFAVAVAILGIFVLLKPWDISTSIPILGIIFGLLGGVFLSLWIIYGRIGGLHKYHPTTIAFGQGFFASIWLVIFLPLILLANNTNIVKFSAYPPIYVVVIVLIAGFSILGVLVFYKGVQKISASTSSIIVLIEPVSAAILAYFLFGQTLSYNIVVGGLLILFSNFLVITGKS
jgi:DME family drug/metabolite transporter